MSKHVDNILEKVGLSSGNNAGDILIRALIEPTPEQLVEITRSIHTLREQQSSSSSSQASNSNSNSNGDGSSSSSSSSSMLPFQLACTLISHTDEAFIREGIDLMETFAFQQWKRVEQHRHDAGVSPTSRNNQDKTQQDTVLLTDCYFYIGVGRCKLDDLNKARASADRMLELVPGHRQGTALKEYIEKQLWKQGAMGLGMLGVVGGVGAVVAAGLLKGLASSRK